MTFESGFLKDLQISNNPSWFTGVMFTPFFLKFGNSSEPSTSMLMVQKMLVFFGGGRVSSGFFTIYNLIFV